MRTKSIFLFLHAVLSILALPLRAEQVLAVVWADNGHEDYFVVADSPIITVLGNEVSVNDALSGKSITLSIAELKHFELKNVDLTPVENMEATDNNVFRMTGNGLEMTGLKEGDVLHVYDIAGRLDQHVQANAQGCASVALGRGIYVIKSNNRTIKIAKR